MFKGKCKHFVCYGNRLIAVFLNNNPYPANLWGMHIWNIYTCIDIRGKTNTKGSLKPALDFICHGKIWSKIKIGKCNLKHKSERDMFPCCYANLEPKRDEEHFGHKWKGVK